MKNFHIQANPKCWVYVSVESHYLYKFPILNYYSISIVMLDPVVWEKKSNFKSFHKAQLVIECAGMSGTFSARPSYNFMLLFCRMISKFSLWYNKETDLGAIDIIESIFKNTRIDIAKTIIAPGE